jgi:hypothetical protein
MNATIHVRFTMPGWHNWPDAPEKRAYLAHEHRHLFHVEVSAVVQHDDREIEFHDLRDNAVAIFRSLGTDGRMGAMSCEMMARAVGADLVECYQRCFKISVWEDGEFGATVIVDPPNDRPRSDATGPAR